MKNHFKRAKLSSLAREEHFNVYKAINEAFKQLTIKKVQNYIKVSMKLLKVEASE